MRVLIISAVYPPEPVLSARLSRDLREYLMALGHHVHVLCPYPSRWARDSINYTPTDSVTRLQSYRCVASQLLGRARESWSFGRQVARWMVRNRSQKFDVAYANIWPLFGQHHVARAARRLRIPLIMHVQDVYPESLATKLSPWLYRASSPLLRTWDRAIARRCAAVILPSPRIADAYQRSRGLDGRVQVVRNWIDPRPFDVKHDRAEVCREYDVRADRFTFMYLGNLSALSALDKAIRAFAQLGAARTQFVIVGEGSMKSECQALVRELRIEDDVCFRSEPHADRVARVQSVADVFVLPTRRGGATASTPSKCISYMFSAKPIVAAVDAESDTADDLRAAGSAWLCASDDVSALATAMRTAYVSDTGVRLSMGDGGRRFAMKHFAADTCLQKFAAALGVPSDRRIL